MTTALPRFEKLPEEKQRRILETAAREFIEHGYEKASLNRIIESAEISKGSMYYYFHDKAHLYVAVVDRLMLDMFDSQPLPDRSVLTAENYWARFRDYMHAAAEHWQAHPEITALAKTVHSLGALKYEEPFVQLMVKGRRWLREIFDAGIELGVVRTDYPLELMMDAWLAVDEVIDRYGAEHWEAMSPEEQRGFVLQGWDLFRRMFEVRP